MASTLVAGGWWKGYRCCCLRRCWWASAGAGVIVVVIAVGVSVMTVSLSDTLPSSVPMLDSSGCNWAIFVFSFSGRSRGEGILGTL